MCVTESGKKKKQEEYYLSYDVRRYTAHAQVQLQTPLFTVLVKQTKTELVEPA